MTPPGRSLVFASIIAAATWIAPPALGQQAQRSAALAAKKLYDEGIDLGSQGKLAEAKARFEQAWALQKSYDIAANLGEIAMRLEKPAEAAVYLTFAVDNYPASGKQEKREWLENRLKEARSKVFALTIAVNVPGAEVRVNGKPAGKAPIGEELFVPPGDCTVEVSAPEYEPWSRKIPAAAGKEQKLQVDLVQPPRSILPGVAAGGAGVAALVTGVALYVVSTNQYDEAKRLHDEILSDTENPRTCAGASPNPRCEALKSAAETSDALFAPGLALLIGGGLLTAAGGAYLGYALKPPSSPAATGAGPRVTSVGVRGPGLFVQGTF